MTDTPNLRESAADPRHETPPRTPRWVKVSGVIFGVAVIVVIVVAALQFAGVGGSHGPGQHGSGGDKTTDSDPPSTDPGVHVPPIEHAP